MGSAPGLPRIEGDDSSTAAPSVRPPRVSEVRAGIWVTPTVRIERPLGEGGMGSVWVAHHTTLDARVAVKFISQRLDTRHGVARKRFEREARIAAKLQHPHVIQVFDHGITEDGVPYIVMELLEGETLAARLHRVGRLSAAETELLVSQLAKVLTMAHDLAVVHRDLKPDNVFLLESDYELFIKVLDFGIAKQTDAGVLGELTHTGAIVGTPSYMSPELLMGHKEVDRHADLWGLAVMAYHALTGRLPFKGETLAALGVKVNEGVFTPPSALVDDAGAELDAWFKIALCRKPELRYQTAREMAHAFRAALHRVSTSSDDGAAPRPRSPVSASGERLQTRDHAGDKGDEDLEPTRGAAPHGSWSEPSSEGDTVAAPMSPLAELRTGATAEAAPAPAAATGRERSRLWLVPLLLVCLAVAGVLWKTWGAPEAPSTRTDASASAAEPIGALPSAAGDVPRDDGETDEVAEPAGAQPSATAAQPNGATAPKSRRAATGPTAATSASSASSATPPPSALPPGGPDCSYPFTVGSAGELVPIRECFP